MSPSLFPFLLTIAGGILYHLAQKHAGSATTPWPILVTAYGAGFLGSAVAWMATPPSRALSRGELGAAVMIGLAALAIEAGFFLAYRAGWTMATASLFSNLAVAATLAVIGVVLFGDALTPSRFAGLVIAALGAWLIVRK